MDSNKNFPIEEEFHKVEISIVLLILVFIRMLYFISRLGTILSKSVR
jgi:hypothetical protein